MWLMEQLALNHLWLVAGLIACRPQRSRRKPTKAEVRRWEQLALAAVWLTADFAASLDLRARRKAAQKLVLENMWIVDSFVAKYRGTGKQADLREAGIMGLVEAANRFDPKAKNKFATYAWNWVRGHMFSEVRKSHVVPIPDALMRQARESGAQVECVMVNRTVDEPVEAEQGESHEAQEALSSLRPQERIIIKRMLAGENVVEVSLKTGISQKRIWEILGEARERLADA